MPGKSQEDFEQMVLQMEKEHQEYRQTQTEYLVIGFAILIGLFLISRNWKSLTGWIGPAFIHIACRFYRAGGAISRRKSALADRIKEAAKE